MSEEGKAKELIEDIDFSKLSTFFKYCSDDDRVIEGIFEDHKIRFTQPAALNDPLEFRPIILFDDATNNHTLYELEGLLLPSIAMWLHLQLVERQLNEFGVLSLTKIPTSFDMWSQYANGHKGFLLELKARFNEHPCMLSRDGTKYDVQKVEYVDEYAINAGDLVDANGAIPFAEYNERVFFTKTSRWNNEGEFRMVRPLADCPDWRRLSRRAHRDHGIYVFDLSLDCVESIVFGACMATAKKRRILEACQGTSIRYTQMYVIQDEMDGSHRPGRLDAVPMDSFPNLLEMHDLGMFVTRRELRRSTPIAITELSELPYYAGNESLVHELWGNRRAREGR